MGRFHEWGFEDFEEEVFLLTKTDTDMLGTF